MGHKTAVAVVLAVVTLTFGLGAKRRSVRSGPCTAATLALTVTPRIACPGETVTLQWRASDFSSLVNIDGIGTNLRWTGSTRVFDGRRTFSGYAVNACGAGERASVTVDAPAPPTGSIAAPSTVQQHTSATLQISASDSASWLLTSSLSNPITPPSGFGDDVATYSASASGIDTLLLQIIDRCNVTTERTASLVVEPGPISPPPPPPPPPAGGLRCCDGTRSPTCNSCSDLRGCCSGHGGVCDCGRTATPELHNQGTPR